MTEKRRAPIEVLERLAEAQANIYRDLHNGDERLPPDVAAYRAATAPLRTRAEVDAEIVDMVRMSGSTPGVPPELSPSSHYLRRLSDLCSEPTADDHGSSSTPAAKESRDNAGVSAGPANALVDRVLASDEPEPEKCGCDESEGLRRELEKFRNELDATRIESAGRHRKLRDIQVEHDIWSTGKKTSATTLDAIGLILKGA